MFGWQGQHGQVLHEKRLQKLPIQEEHYKMHQKVAARLPDSTVTSFYNLCHAWWKISLCKSTVNQEMFATRKILLCLRWSMNVKLKSLWNFAAILKKKRTETVKGKVHGAAAMSQCGLIFRNAPRKPTIISQTKRLISTSNHRPLSWCES